MKQNVKKWHLCRGVHNLGYHNISPSGGVLQATPDPAWPARDSVKFKLCCHDDDDHGYMKTLLVCPEPKNSLRGGTKINIETMMSFKQKMSNLNVND